MKDIRINIMDIISSITGRVYYRVLPAYADDAAAGVAGLTVGKAYQTDGTGAPPLNVPGIKMIKQ